MKRIAAPTLICAMILAGCAGRNPLTIPRPNARTPLEERAFNALLVSERLITEAETSNAAGTLPEFMRPIIDGLIKGHNLAKDAADKYTAALNTAEEVGTATALADLLVDLDGLISGMFQTGGTP